MIFLRGGGWEEKEEIHVITHDYPSSVAPLGLYFVGLCDRNMFQNSGFILAYISEHPHSWHDTTSNVVPDRILEMAEGGV